jgi:hypothetical protein
MVCNRGYFMNNMIENKDKIVEKYILELIYKLDYNKLIEDCREYIINDEYSNIELEYYNECIIEIKTQLDKIEAR